MVRLDTGAIILSVALWAHTCSSPAQDYIRYHQEAIAGYEYRLAGNHRAAVDVFEHLAEKYSLLPTESYALGYGYAVLGDTANARIFFMTAATQGSGAGWMDIDRDSLLQYVSPAFFNEVNRAYFTSVLRDYPYKDGPNPGQPVPTTRINDRYQTVIDSLTAIYGGYGRELNGYPDACSAYKRVREEHEPVLDSIIAGHLPLPSIQRYGMNGEFETFTFHITPAYLFAQREILKDWLAGGKIFPRVYANCFDQMDRELGSKMTYGVLLGYTEEDLAPGYEQRRRNIGMGNDRVDSIRFHWFVE